MPILYHTPECIARHLAQCATWFYGKCSEVRPESPDPCALSFSPKPEDQKDAP